MKGASPNSCPECGTEIKNNNNRKDASFNYHCDECGSTLEMKTDKDGKVVSIKVKKIKLGRKIRKEIRDRKKTKKTR